jgi:hypothetical protein
MRPYDAWTNEEALICAWAMFIWAAALGYGYLVAIGLV